MPNKIMIATNNPGKMIEFQQIYQDLPIQLVFPQDLDIELSVEENGQTYFENALLKAEIFFAASGIPTLADDSGLEVDLLNGEPGIHSHRYTGNSQATDIERRFFLLNKLVPLPRPWNATFRCVIVVIDTNGKAQLFNGFCRGEIIPEERGSGGFGYDPIFFIPELNATMAELPSDIKNKISHRAKAALAAMPFLETLFS